MASRTDQLHSHQFARQRAVGALAMRDPHPAGSPGRRAAGALFAGVMLAALTLAAVGAYAVIRPGRGTSWQDGGSVIVERETGAQFVYRDGLLHPVPNYTSALLVLGSPEPETVLVSRASLDRVPRGAMLGIPGAPDRLPARNHLISAVWTLCSRHGSGAGTESVLFIGARPQAQALPDGGVLARDPGGRLHLLWRGHRFRIVDRQLVLAALGWREDQAVPVSSSLLSVIEAGSDLAPIRPAGIGSAVDGVRVGRVFVVENQDGARRYAVGTRTGLADITQVQADLTLADPANPANHGEPTRMTPAAFAAARHAASLVPSGGSALPAVTPSVRLPPPAGGVCAGIGPDATTISLIAEAQLTTGRMRVPGRPGISRPPASRDGTGVDEADGADRLDWVSIEAGAGAVVESLTGPDARTGAVFVVTEQGVRYPVSSVEVLPLLGLAEVRPQRLPAALIALLPAGPVLDPAAVGPPHA